MSLHSRKVLIQTKPYPAHVAALCPEVRICAQPVAEALQPWEQLLEGSPVLSSGRGWGCGSRILIARALS